MKYKKNRGGMLQPIDEKGRYARKSFLKISRNPANYEIIVESSNSYDLIDPFKSFPTIPENIRFNKNTIEKHIQEHQNGLTKAHLYGQYEKLACLFFKETTLYDDWYRRKNGDIVKYRYSTNEFGVADKNGVIRTYFIPRQGYKYYERKKENENGK